MTSSSGVTCTRDQSPESSQSDSTKFCKLFWRVADKHRQIFAGKPDFPMGNIWKTRKCLSGICLLLNRLFLTFSQEPTTLRIPAEVTWKSVQVQKGT